MSEEARLRRLGGAHLIHATDAEKLAFYQNKIAEIRAQQAAQKAAQEQPSAHKPQA